MGQCQCWGSSNDLWIMVRSVALDHEARGRIRHEMRYFHLTVSFREENWGIIVILYIMLKYEPVWSPRAQSAIAKFSLPQSQDTFAEPIRVNITQNATDPRGKITTSINAVTSALKQTQIPRKIEKRYVLTKKVHENLDKAAQLKTKIENWHEETQRARFTRKDSRNSEIRANEKNMINYYIIPVGLKTIHARGERNCMRMSYIENFDSNSLTQYATERVNNRKIW
jgi:hypothetical protein